jgi:DNA-binding LytR/AlgR family response regulator
MNPRAVIAEDEPLLAQALVAALRAAWPELEIAAVAANGVEALERIDAEKPEVVFLDIRMPGLTGLEVAAELAERGEEGARVPRIVFVTAYEEFAVKAFELAAVDYLLKPLAPARLAQTVARMKGLLASTPDDVARLAARLSHLFATPPSTTHRPFAVIRAGTGNTVRMIPVDEVIYFQASDKYVSVVTADAELLIRLSLKELLAQLPAERFRQVHRGTIVNLAQVEAARRDDSGRVTLKLRRRGETLAVSRVFAEQFRPM